MNGTDDDQLSDPLRGPGGHARTARAALALLAWLAAGTAVVAQQSGDAASADELAQFGALMLAQPFPYEARDVPVTDMLREMSQRSGVPVILDEGVGGRVDLGNAEGTVRDALQALAESGRAVWWFDGAAVHVEPSAAVVSRLIPLRGVPLTALRREMQALRLDDANWPLIAADDAQVVRVVGPRGYAAAIEELIAALSAELSPAASPRLPVVIRGPGRRRGGGLSGAGQDAAGWIYPAPAAPAPLMPPPAAAVPAAPVN